MVQRNAPLFLSRTADLPRVGLRRVGDAVTLGFDSEWDPRTQGRPLLSFQLAIELADGRVVGRVIDAPAPRLEPIHVVHSVRALLAELGVEAPLRRGRRSFYLVAHFAQAELSMFSDAHRDFRIRQIGKAHFASLLKAVLIEGEKWVFIITDLWAFYPMALKKVGDAVGLAKVEIEDRGDLARLKLADRAEFDAYALRDAEIAVVAFNRLRALLLTEYGVDTLIHRTLAGVASAIFRHGFLKSAPAPVERVLEPYWRRTSAQGWRRAQREVPTFAGEPAVRSAALRAYWGGRVEAYGRGLLQVPVEERDVVSLYPHAALAQPLPNAQTKWRAITAISEVTTHEGFGRFEFTFPADCRYPCLPVHPEDRLVFPLSGTTDCTFSEIRLALRFGAEVRAVEAHGFRPGDAEKNHDLGHYMREFIAKKASATKGTLEYDTWKLLLNALVGKLAEQTDRNLILSLEHEARQHGLTGVGGVVASSGVLRGAVHLDAGVGGLWAPEWASLILGKARAIVGAIVAASSPVLVSTDAVVVPAGTAITCPELALLEDLGSGLTVEKQADAVFIGRSRQYALLTRLQNLGDKTRSLARDDVWAVVKAARHGSVESEEEFAETILASLRARRDAAPPRSKIRLLGAEAAVREFQPINAEVEKVGKTHFKWDGKRRLLDRDANPFTSWTPTVPYTSTARLTKAEAAREVARYARWRALRKRARWKLRLAAKLLRQGKGVRETARATGIPKSTVSDLRQRLLAGDNQDLRPTQASERT